jgi:hypothetical protein
MNGPDLGQAGGRDAGDHAGHSSTVRARTTSPRRSSTAKTMTIRTAEQHSDWFARNLVAILCEERLALAVFRAATGDCRRRDQLRRLIYLTGPITLA